MAFKNWTTVLEKRFVRPFVTVCRSRHPTFGGSSLRQLGQGGGNFEAAPGHHTALHEAAQQGHLDVVRCLLEAGADKDSLTCERDTPVIYAS